MKDNLGDLMKQAQKLQAEMEKAQKELSELKIIGEAGGGIVKVMMTGQHYLKKAQVSEDALKEGKAFLEDLVVAAVNDAVKKVEKMSRQKMTTLASGIGMPPGMEMPKDDEEDF